MRNPNLLKRREDFIFLKDTLRNAYSKQIQSFGVSCVPLAPLCNPQNKVSIVLPHRLNNYLAADMNHMNAFNWEYGQQNGPLAPSEACLLFPSFTDHWKTESYWRIEARHFLRSKPESFQRAQEYRLAVWLFVCVHNIPVLSWKQKTIQHLVLPRYDKVTLEELLHHRK